MPIIYFSPIPDSKTELAKYALAKSVFDHIRDIANDTFDARDLVITNLYNKELPHSPEKRTVFIPQTDAEIGLHDIRDLLSRSRIRFIFVMSMQVNYWLQKLGFYDSDNGYVERAAPKRAGMLHEPPFYQPTVGGCFKDICGNLYVADGKYSLFPILHTKNYPLRGKFVTYESSYNRMRGQIRQMVDGRVRN